MNITWNFILAQIFGLFALCILGYSFQKDNKKNLLGLQTISSLFFALQYMFLFAWTGALMNFICIVRNHTFNKYKKNKIPTKIVLILMVLMIILSYISWAGWISILPTIAIIAYTLALTQSKLKIIRMTEILSCTLFIIYNIKVLAITGLISTIVELLLASIAIVRYDILKNHKAENIIL